MIYRPRIKPWPHQRKALQKLWKMGGALLWFDVRTGKTKVCVDYAAARHQAGKCRRVLVVCPLSAVGVWEREIVKNMPEDVPVEIESQIRWKGLKETPEAVGRLRNSRMGWIIVTYNALHNYAKVLAEYRPNLLIFDESHRLKNYSATRTRRALFLSRNADSVLCLSGTPVPNGYQDIYYQIKLINPMILPPTLREFKERYCITDHWGSVLGYRNTKELARRLRQVTLRASKELLDLPPVLDQEIPLQLDAKTRSLYDKLKKEFVATLANGHTVLTNNQLTLLLRLSQITGGFLDGQRIGDAKLKVLLDLLDSELGKVIIWCRFIAEIEAIKEKIPDSAVIVGKTPGRERVDIIRRFQNDPKPRILIAQISTLNEAVDLTAASTAIYYSLDWSSEVYEQTRGRLHGPGQKQSVTYRHLVAVDTVDEQLLAAVRAKMNRQELLAELVRGLRDG